MPILGLAHVLIGVFFAVHAMKTGRPQFWLWILLMVPLVGSIAYVVFELVPELGQTRRVRKVKQGLSDIVAPDRELKRLYETAQETETVEAQQQLAAEYERRSMWPEAIKLYANAARGLYAEDPVLLTGLARAHLENGTVQSALDVLERLRAAHPNGDTQEAHLVYARCMEDLGRNAEALEEYGALANYYIGLEARTRYGLLLTRMGQPEQARKMFQSVVRASTAKGVALTDNDTKWLKVAKANV